MVFHITIAAIAGRNAGGLTGHAGSTSPRRLAGTGRWHIQESFRRKDSAVGIVLPHYDDTYLIEDGEWKFADRKLVRHYHGAPDLSDEFLTPIVTA
ncbi:hypothetical protein N8342_11420 [Acidimicrobiales bacterium]|jgi:hypothetical protein|nr:hypothetical protein [bacterium]MDC1390427.1 hypothetical protein [Acidimicrobiales bacterium]